MSSAAPVEGKMALIFDDMISTAGSICGAAQVMHDAGAKQIFLAATHGLLVRRGGRSGSKRPRSTRWSSRTRFPCRRKRPVQDHRLDSCPLWGRRSNGSTGTSRSAVLFK